MKQIMQQYGSAAIASLAFVLVIALTFTTSIMGSSGMLSALGASMTFSGDSADGLAQGDTIRSTNSAGTYSVTLNANSVEPETAVDVSTLATLWFTDSSGNTSEANADILITRLTDSEGNNAFNKTGCVTYDRANNKITFHESGTYEMILRVKGESKMIRETFHIAVVSAAE